VASVIFCENMLKKLSAQNIQTYHLLPQSVVLYLCMSIVEERREESLAGYEVGV
jgi:hypothetical protein